MNEFSNGLTKFTRAKRLKQHLIGAGIHRGLVGLRIRKRREYTNRDIGPPLLGAEPATDLKAISPRHHEVEEKEVRVDRRRALKGSLSILHPGDLKILIPLKHPLNHMCDGMVVFCE
jgi:hypothetical protein